MRVQTIDISSTAGRTCGTKFGVHALTESIREAVAWHGGDGLRIDREKLSEMEGRGVYSNAHLWRYRSIGSNNHNTCALENSCLAYVSRPIAANECTPRGRCRDVEACARL